MAEPSPDHLVAAAETPQGLAAARYVAETSEAEMRQRGRPQVGME